MKRASTKILCLILTLVLGWAAMALAAKAQPAPDPRVVNNLLLESYNLLEKGKYDAAEKMLDQILAEDPNDPLALNNLAAIMVKKQKLDRADTYLNQALPRARGYMVQVNRVCQIGGICLAFKPVIGSIGNQELAPLIMLNIDLVKQYMSEKPPSGQGTR